MSQRDSEFYTRLASWLDQPRLPGEERAFREWMEKSEENRLEWNQWESLVTEAKRLTPDALDVDTAWAELRQDLGFRRVRQSSGRSSRSSSKAKDSSLRDLLNRPLVLAFVSMFVLSLYFLMLYYIRTAFGF